MISLAITISPLTGEETEARELWNLKGHKASRWQIWNLNWAENLEGFLLDYLQGRRGGCHFAGFQMVKDESEYRMLLGDPGAL